MTQNVHVAPLAGAWIEIVHYVNCKNLKSVAPLAGAWIEITKTICRISGACGRSPRGSVD